MTRYLITYFKDEIYVLHKEAERLKGVSLENYILQGSTCYLQVGEICPSEIILREKIQNELENKTASFSIDRGMDNKKKTDISKIILEEITKGKK